MWILVGCAHGVAVGVPLLDLPERWKLEPWVAGEGAPLDVANIGDADAIVALSVDPEDALVVAEDAVLLPVGGVHHFWVQAVGPRPEGAIDLVVTSGPLEHRIPVE